MKSLALQKSVTSVKVISNVVCTEKMDYVAESFADGADIVDSFGNVWDDEILTDLPISRKAYELKRTHKS